MATEAVGVNGVYDAQYNQPAELAATTPSHTTSAPQSQASAGAQSQKADPQEIGWYFVEQYYTTLSKTPERIHLFYSKKSQLVTGIEAEKVVPALGTKAISEKIKALDFHDCKVRVLNVDSQSSFDNIVVQVIGEMSNKSQPHHKFVQTFVLATQPNGYYVLNDIFRYLNNDEDDLIEDQSYEQAVPAAEPATHHETTVPVSADAVTTAEAADLVDVKLKDAEHEAATEELAPNGVGAEQDSAEATSTVVEPATQEPLPIPTPERPAEPEPTPVSEVAKTLDAPAAPPAKKTWASLVGNKAPAVPALPVASPAPTGQPKTQRPVASVAVGNPSTERPAASAAAPVTVTPATTESNDEWQTADHKKTKGGQSKATEGNVYAYIKNVTDKIDARELRRVLEQYGDLKYFDVSRPRNSAFVEFATPAGYAAAVAANPHSVNEETITVEERRPRPGTFASGNNNANSANNANYNRGGTSGGRGRGNASRGGFQPRGGKPGNVTPKGRGQAQAV